MANQDPPTREMVQKLKEGMDESSLLREYNLSEEKLQALLDELFETSFSTRQGETDDCAGIRAIEAEEIIRDIRGGLNETELKLKYGLTSGALAKTVKLLLDGDHLNRGDLSQGAVPYEEVVDMGKSRLLERYYLDFGLPIVDVDFPDVAGTVRDLTTKGLGTSGIRASMDEIKTLRIQHPRFVSLKSFTFQAKCRWVRDVDSGGKATAGFEIVSMSDKDTDQLRKLVKLLRFYAVSTARVPATDPESSSP